MIDFLVGLGVLSIVVVLLFGLGAVKLQAYGSFDIWALLAAFGALVAGGALGLLFGLPTVRRVEISQTTISSSANAEAIKPDDVAEKRQSSSAPSDTQLGHAESTNLEQVADWLTKIIIGLTLTQYAKWEQSFARLSFDLTSRLLGAEQTCEKGCNGQMFPPGSTIPGGFLLVFFSVLWFLISYLWMRGYFILEMEIARRNALDAAARQRREEWQEEQRKAALSRADVAENEAKAAQERLNKLQTEAAAVQAETDQKLALTESELAEARAQRARAQEELVRAQEAGLAQRKPTDIGGSSPGEIAQASESRASRDAAEVAAAITTGVAQTSYPDNPWRGQFNGQSKADDTELSATVTPWEKDPFYFTIKLIIKALSPERAAILAGKSALVYLHPTFGPDPRSVSFNPEGVAELELLSYGAFTVGVLLDTGTKLELNLAELRGVDTTFLTR